MANCTARIQRLDDGRDKLVLDDGWRIIGEYQANLRSAGQPGIGDAFLKWVLTNHRNPSRCALVTITPDGDSFKEFPHDEGLDGFDLADHKFIAVAQAHDGHPTVLQALDLKWQAFQGALKRNGVVVEFLCPDAVSS